MRPPSVARRVTNPQVHLPPACTARFAGSRNRDRSHIAARVARIVEPKATGPSESPPTSAPNATQPPQRKSNINQAPLLRRIVLLGWGLSTAMLCRWSNRSFTTPARIRRLFGSNSCREVTRLSAEQFGRSTEARVPWYAVQCRTELESQRCALAITHEVPQRASVSATARRSAARSGRRDLSQKRRRGGMQPTRLRRRRTVC